MRFASITRVLRTRRLWLVLPVLIALSATAGIALATNVDHGVVRASAAAAAPVSAPAGHATGSVCTPARIAGKAICLSIGQRCKPTLDSVYRRYGFACGASHRLRLVKKLPRQVSIAVTGKPSTVFDWSASACDMNDIPDLPARAFRDADGNVQLLSAHFVNRRFIGPDLDHLSHPCDVIMNSNFNGDPSAFDDAKWISAPYTTDGKTVYALVHEEYHGWDHPGQCTVPPAQWFDNCWFNAITLAVSNDAGRTYADASPRLIATGPEKYTPNAGLVGVFTPSNIVKNPADGFYYTFVYRIVRQQQIGDCLLRTKHLGDAASWRAWTGGTSFGQAFVNPYTTPGATICTPINHGPPGDFQPNSLLYSTVARQWLFVGQAVEGAYFMLSPNLINWTQPRLFWRAQVTWDYTCGKPDPIAYPSVIDSTSTSRNFETIGSTAYLYYTQFHYSNCEQTMDRDLVRVPIEVKPS